MMLPRIYQNTALAEDAAIKLDAEATHHLANVLRVKKKDYLILFNGIGGEFLVSITEINKRSLTAYIEKFIDISRESPLKIHLAQSIARGEKMDFIIQKAVELGIHQITPLLTEHSNVKLSRGRQEKRFSHWQKVMISATEQCGRNILPILNSIISFEAFIQAEKSDMKLILHPNAKNTFSSIKTSPSSITLLIGPEGGFSETEIALARKTHFIDISLGPRILRTETASLATIAALQSKFGDY